MRGHVRARLPGVDQLLDRLLVNAVAVNPQAGSEAWVRAVDLALAQPELVVVTMDGDRFAASGWRTGAGGTGATGAALEEARARAEAATVHAQRAGERVAEAKELLGRAVEQDLQRADQDTARRLKAATEALARLESERRDVVTEDGTIAAHLEELSERLSREEARVAELEAVLPDLEAEEAAGTERAMAQRVARGRLDERATAVQTLRRELEYGPAAWRSGARRCSAGSARWRSGSSDSRQRAGRGRSEADPARRGGSCH